MHIIKLLMIWNPSQRSGQRERCCALSDCHTLLIIIVLFFVLCVVCFCVCWFCLFACLSSLLIV